MGRNKLNTVVIKCLETAVTELLGVLLILYLGRIFLSVFQQVLRIGSLTLTHSRSIHHSSICRTPLIPIVVEQTVSVIIWTAEAGLSVFSRSVYTVSIEVYIQYKYMMVSFLLQTKMLHKKNLNRCESWRFRMREFLFAWQSKDRHLYKWLYSC